MISEGTHDASVMEHGLTETKNGTPQVAVKFLTDEGEITGFFFLTDRSVEHTVERLQAMGFAGRSFAELNSGCMVGNPCVIVVRHEEYQGKTQIKVAWVNPPGDHSGGGGGANIDKNEAVARAAARFDSLLRKANPTPAPAAPAARPQAAPTPAAPAAPAEADEPAEDIPF